MDRPVLVSGIQPTGRLHIGNYLGALKNFVTLQNSGKYRCYFFIADLHSLTDNADPATRRESIKQLAADFFAAGLDSEQSVIFRQSDIPWHANLAWVFETITPVGELERMTQFKDKASRQKSNVNAGLLTYPTLMASDILLYNPDLVPVGDDQSQHLELTRTVARRFNKKFGQTFKEPKMLLTATPRVMSLDDPTKKMSKSVPKGCLFLDDDPDTVTKKIKAAVTDSKSGIAYDPKHRAGLANLLEILAGLRNTQPAEVAEEMSGKTYAEFKTEIADAFVDAFAMFREEKTRLLKESDRMAAMLDRGNKKADTVAKATWNTVEERTGLVTDDDKLW